MSFRRNLRGCAPKPCPSRIALWLALAVTYSAAAATSTQAAEADVPFQGSVAENSSCIIVVQQEGLMTATPDATQMSSAFAGGTFGMADIYSFRNYFITAEPPSFFDTAPPGGFTGVSFSTTFSGEDIFRGRNFAWQPGTNAVRLRGSFSITRVRVHLHALKPDAFPAGDYTAHATMRCE